MGHGLLRWFGFSVMALAGCSTLPEGEAFFEPVTLAQRQVQTRQFEATEGMRVLQASIAVLLDNGFEISQVKNRLGWVYAYKAASRKPEHIFLYGGIFYATVVARAADDRPGITLLRVTFHAEDFRTYQYGGFHLIENPEVYQKFFTRLRKSLFLRTKRT